MLNNIKTLKDNRGFTIVELLIVIVVIAILAAITIVAYNGIQNQAKTTKAKTNAVSVQKVAEALAAAGSSDGGLGRYPTTTAEFSGSTVSKLPNGITLIVGASTNITAGSSTSDKENGVDYEYKGSVSAPTGAKITYWDFTTGALSTTVIYLGDAKSGDTFTGMAS